MRTNVSGDIILTAASIVVSFAATMIAIWSFTHLRLAWGAYNFAIALVALAVIAAVRAHAHRT